MKYRWAHYIFTKVLVLFKSKTKTKTGSQKTKTWQFKTKTKTDRFGLETTRDQDRGLEFNNTVWK